AAFGLLALGPVLHVAGRAMPATDGLMPYALLARAFPPLSLSGMPVRMVVMVQLGAAMICALGLPALWRAGRGWRALTALLLAVAVVEYLPAPLPETRPAPPPYLAVLQSRPDHLAVLDTATDQYRALYYQTLHGRPLAFGYVSRLPASVAARDAALLDLVRARRYAALARAGFGYLILSPADAAGAPPCAAPLYRDAEVTVYAIAECATAPLSPKSWGEPIVNAAALGSAIAASAPSSTLEGTPPLLLATPPRPALGEGGGGWGPPAPAAVLYFPRDSGCSYFVLRASYFGDSGEGKPGCSVTAASAAMSFTRSAASSASTPPARTSRA
ncbi:MAG TPA: hypothetical protein VFL91_33550, partial [Thermomicrobiales bacterium]|nr:hypothetical protein [Thermomicrobiales bacterium]